MLVLEERGKPEYPEKTSRSRVENQQLGSPHMAPGPEIGPGPDWWKASALTTTPSLLPRKRFISRVNVGISFQDAKMYIGSQLQFCRPKDSDNLIESYTLS